MFRNCLNMKRSKEKGTKRETDRQTDTQSASFELTLWIIRLSLSSLYLFADGTRGTIIII